MGRAVARAFGATCWLLTFGCTRPEPDGTWPPRGADADPITTIEAWLFCDHCDRGERTAVASLGGGAAYELDWVLTRIPDQWESNIKMRYGAIAHRTGLSPADSTKLVGSFWQNFKATVQSRSAYSLGDVKGDQAREALERALSDTAGRAYRDDVIRAIRLSLITLTATPFGGSGIPNTNPFLDTVWLRRPSGDWDGDESVILHGAPFPTDVTVGFRAPGRLDLGFVAGGMPGNYGVEITGVGAGQAREYGQLVIASFPAQAAGAVPQLTEADLPYTSILSLSRAAARQDTIRAVRILPASNITVTAQADWTGGAPVTLFWADCQAPLRMVGNPGWIAGRVVDPAGSGLGGAQVRPIGLSLAATADGQGRFEITGVPPGWSGDLLVVRSGYENATIPSRERTGDAWVILSPAGSPPPPLVAGAEVATQSPNELPSLPIGGGECRAIGVKLAASPSSTPPIVRLRLTTP